MNDQGINICQPGFGASCALCCGSHEGKVSMEELEGLYKKRAVDFKLMEADKKPYNMNCRVPPAENLPCPWIGSLDSGTKSGIIGCLIYNNPEAGGASWFSFINRTCRYFSCQARDTLSCLEIEYAARLFKDWFFYSLIIHLPDKLRETMKLYSSPELVPVEVYAGLQEYLISQI